MNRAAKRDERKLADRIKRWQEKRETYPGGSQLQKSADYVIWCLREQQAETRV